MRLQPKKSLGQNFLVDGNLQRKIVAAFALKPSDVVLEIGAGRGELTRLLAESRCQVYAVELDAALCALLKDKFKEYRNVRVIHQNFLNLNLNLDLAIRKNHIKVVGNIPYYISTPIIEHLFDSRDIIEIIFLTVQKEFAQRMVARPGSKDYGSLSCFVQYYAEAKILFRIKKSCFRPQPKVDSALVELKIKQASTKLVKDEELFFKIIRSAFNQRRKILRNSLSSVLPAVRLEEFFQKYRINKNIRPEDLSLEDFANLANT